jgi:hypothetical protein
MKSKMIGAILLLVLFSCKKNTTGVNPPLLEEGFPQDWVFTYDENATEYTYLRSNNGNPLYRKQVLKTYDLKQLAIDEDCKFKVMENAQRNGKKTYTIQSVKQKKRWWSVNFVNNANNPEGFVSTFLSSSSTEPPCGGTPDDCDDWRFFLHRMPDVNGVRSYAIESVKYPGWYISRQSPNFQYANNLLTVQKQPNVEQATKFQCRQ